MNCFCRFNPAHEQILKDISSLPVSIHVFCVNLPDFTFPVDVILVNILGRTTAKPAGRAVFASAAAVHGTADDFFPFFFCCIFNQYGFHIHLSFSAGAPHSSIYHLTVIVFLSGTTSNPLDRFKGFITAYHIIKRRRLLFVSYAYQGFL